MAIRGVCCNYDQATRDIQRSNMEFSVLNVTCVEDDTACAQCFTVQANGLWCLYALEFTKDPDTYKLSAFDGISEWDFQFVQDDLAGQFRFCIQLQNYFDEAVHADWRDTLCLDNDFTEIAVPRECSRPLITLTIDSHMANGPVMGGQYLYCIP
ncbi:uncharacterized protein LOC119728391 isoform X2 [Patiria miniata]|nr:uncharacterized protein LOC119728391 isoform X2 [Patiria miniata]